MVFPIPTLPYQIPMKPLEFVEDNGDYDNNTGEWVDSLQAGESFDGAILPLSEKDLLRSAGTYTIKNRKLYTHSTLINVNDLIRNPRTGEVYTVDGDLGYEELNTTFRRFILSKYERTDR